MRLKYSQIWGSYSKGETMQATGLSANKPDRSTVILSINLSVRESVTGLRIKQFVQTSENEQAR
jgi:hypothetical protein